ncbi:Bug family tripartite tricarboxylate transporter substrate binding protein [Hydrogenophaga sp.]|jgi:tripartite-type tricarboxylate transporter receptor subunit TctC|uniref:Bug family tripartite tricarboxylate transporter substrate binding protein n=1 Tax=Hydrogenophaga sp. TaxID=1904254 RepID=UPI003F7223F8
MKKFTIALLAASFAAAVPAQATFPSKPVTLVIPFSAGGPADIIARTIAPRLQQELGQPIVIDNRGGGNGNIAHAMVARAPADGHTLVYVAAGIVTNPSLFSGPMVDPFKELAPVAQLTTQSYVLLAHPSFKPRTLAELLAEAGRRPVTCASGGALPSFGCDWLRSISGKDVVHVRYKGTQALTDLMGGHVDTMIDLFNTALPQIRSGAVRPIALTRGERGQPLPDLEVFSETLPGFVLEGWHGIMAPAGTPPERIERLNAAFARALADADVRSRISESYIDVTPKSAAEFGKVLRQDFDKYARIVRDAGIKPQ